MTRRRMLLDPAVQGTEAAPTQFPLTLVVRRWCSLCDKMRDALGPIAQRRGLAVAEVDLDAHPEWESRFGERVPVLLRGAAPDGEVLAELALDGAVLEQKLAGAREIR